MEALRSYLLSVIAAAVICWMATALMRKDGAVSALGKLLAGVFMTVTILSPVVTWKLPNISVYADQFSADASEAVAMGKCVSNEAMASIIKQQCEAYILDKADDFGARLTVTISMSEDSLPVPCAVEVTGDCSPYARLRLMEIIQEDLGIGEEAQTWEN